MYNFNHLYYFYITVKSDGVTSAAKHLSISLPSLSGQIKVLENFLQIKLFRKVGRKNELTIEGSVIFGYCRQMFELSEEMHESILNQIPYVSRRINIGVSDEIANSFVVEVISNFLGKFTDKLRPKVIMTTGGYQKLSEQLRFREVDIVFSTRIMTNPDLKNLKKIEVPVNLVCKQFKKLSKKQNEGDIFFVLKSIEKDIVSDWVMPSPGLKLRSEIDSFFEENSLQGRIAFESDVVESLTRSVVDKIGVAFLPLVYVKKELENKSLNSYGPKGGYWKHRIWLSCHRKNLDDSLLNSLTESFNKTCKSLIS